MGLFNLFGKKDLPESESLASNKPASTLRRRLPSLKARDYGASKIGDSVASWTQAPKTADQSIYQNLRILRARSRDQFEGNDYARRFVGMVKTHVVGPDGFTFQASIIGLDGEQDVLANNAIEQAWKEWQRARTCDAAQRLHFTDICRLLMGSVAMDGEVIIQRRMGPKYGDNQYALKFIDPELLDVAYNDNLKNGHKIRFGIEFDDDDRPVAYFFKKSADTVYLGTDISKNYTRVDAGQITHLFITERVGQRRGIPWLATPLLRMQMLDGYSEAALMAARIGASKAIFYTSDPDADPAMSGIASLAEDGELIDQVEPGSANILPPGVNIESYDPTYPHSDFDTFTKTQLRSIASGLGVSYHKLANDLEGVNYSSGRLGEMEDREIWKQLQTWLIEGYLRPLYEDWLQLQLKLGTITVPTKNSGLKPLSGSPEKYMKVLFQGRRWAWTDPLKEAKGNQLNLESFMTSPQRVLRDSGFDPEEIVNDWAKWRDMLASKGFEIKTPAKDQSTGGDTNANQNEKDTK